MKNPIFIEYYSHENCDCYKVLNPWTDYAKDIRVLCRVDEGIEKARRIASEVLIKCLFEAMKNPLTIERVET